jgi:hypothetical protein
MSALLAAALVALQGCTKVNVSQILKGFEGTAVELSAITGGVGSRGCNIVMVMDNSGSMADEQAALAVAVQALAQIAPSFSSANLRFFSLTTDFYLHATGRVDSGYYTDLHDTNFQPKLQALLQPGIGGNSSERFHQTLKRFLVDGNAREAIIQEPCFAFVIVTDEQWQSTNDLPSATVQLIQNFISSNFTVPDVAATYFVAAVNDPATDVGGRYASLVNLVGNGSFTHSIRTTDWSTHFFEVLTNRVQQVLRRTNSYSFYIQPCVLPESVRVSIRPAGGLLQQVPSTLFEVGPDLHRVYLDPEFVNSLQSSTQVFIQYFEQFCPATLSGT